MSEDWTATDDSPVQEVLRDFGDFELLEELSRGGMGVVYRARQKSLNRLVAVKLILAGQNAGEQAIQRFQVEAKAAAALSHPNIVPVYEVGRLNREHFLCMRLVEGSRQLHPEPGDLRQCARLVLKLALALHYAHERGVIHRDLKPCNVLIDPNGEPQLIDFGLAKLMEDESGLTRSLEVMGTPAYMAPETARGGSGQITVATDIYGLGAILYELITGRPPFADHQGFELLQQVAQEDPKRPSTVNQTLDPDLETICLKCLQKEPKRRYASAAELSEDINRWLRNEPILARPVTDLERLGKWVRRHPARAALVTLTLCAAAAFLVQSQISRGKLQIERDAALYESGRARIAEARADAERLRVETSLARLRLKDSLHAKRAGKSMESLALLSRILRADPANRAAAHRLLNAFQSRRFAIPGIPSLPGSGDLHLGFLSPDERWIVTDQRFTRKSETGGVQMWDARTGAKSLSIDNWACFGFNRTGAALLLSRGAGPLYINDLLSNQSRTVPWDRIPEEFRALRLWNLTTDETRALSSYVPANYNTRLLRAFPHPQRDLFLMQYADGRVDVVDTEGTGLSVSTFHGIQPAGAANRVRFTQGNPVAIHPDGITLFAIANDGRVVEGDWDFGWKNARTIHGEPSSRELILRDDGALLAMTTSTGEIAVVFLNYPSKKSIVIRSPHPHPIMKAAIHSRHSNLVATGDASGRLMIWDIQSSPRLVAMKQFPLAIIYLKHSPDGSKLLVGFAGNPISLLSPETGDSLLESIHHRNVILSYQFNHRGDRLLTTSSDDTAQYWDLRLPDHPSYSLKENESVAFINFDERTQSLIVGVSAVRESRSRILLLDAERLHLKREIDGEGFRCLTACLIDETLIRVRENGRVDFLNKKDEAIAFYHPRIGPLLTVSIGVEQRVLAMASRNGGIAAYDLGSRKELMRSPVRIRNNTPLTLSPDGAYLAGISRNGLNFLVWKVQTGTVMATVNVGLRINQIQFSRDSQRIFASSWSGEAGIWNVETGAALVSGIGDRIEPVMDVDFSHSDEWFATTGRGDTVSFSSAESIEPVFNTLYYDENISQIWLAPDDRRLIALSTTRAGVWDIHHNVMLYERSLAGTPSQVTVSPNRTRMAWFDGHSIRLWILPFANGPVPEWMLDMVDSLVGYRLMENDFHAPVSQADYFSIRDRLRSGALNDEYAKSIRGAFKEEAR